MNELTPIQIIVVSIIPMILAITVHETAHGWVAKKFGDNTASMQGRLTLNPIKHIDLIGTVVIPFLTYFTGFIFGWAKPVPVDARNFKNPRRDMAIVALASCFKFANGYRLGIVNIFGRRKRWYCFISFS